MKIMNKIPNRNDKEMEETPMAIKVLVLTMYTLQDQD